ncbi:MAG: bL28 family ribosomal protein [Planctomycetota bacterium]
MPAQCFYCEKSSKVGGAIVYSGLAVKVGGIGLNRRKTLKRMFKPNLQKVRARVGGAVRRIKVCTSCMKKGRLQKP